MALEVLQKTVSKEVRILTIQKPFYMIWDGLGTNFMTYVALEAGSETCFRATLEPPKIQRICFVDANLFIPDPRNIKSRMPEADSRDPESVTGSLAAELRA